MKEAKPYAISMTSQQRTKLKQLAVRLKIPQSRIVNHLIALTENNQILQDLILKIDEFPGNTTTLGNSQEELAIIKNAYEKWYEALMDYANDEIKRQVHFMKWKAQQDLIGLAKTKWLDD